MMRRRGRRGSWNRRNRPVPAHRVLAAIRGIAAILLLASTANAPFSPSKPAGPFFASLCPFVLPATRLRNPDPFTPTR